MFFGNFKVLKLIENRIITKIAIIVIISETSETSLNIKNESIIVIILFIFVYGNITDIFSFLYNFWATLVLIIDKNKTIADKIIIMKSILLKSAPVIKKYSTIIHANK